MRALQAFLLTSALATVSTFLVVGAISSPFLVILGFLGYGGYVLAFDVVVSVLVGLLFGFIGVGVFMVLSYFSRAVIVTVALVLVAAAIVTLQPEVGVLAVPALLALSPGARAVKK